MKDMRTETEKYDDWVDAVVITAKAGWRHHKGWVFKSPSGYLVDLSASDLRKLRQIEETFYRKLQEQHNG